VLELEHNGHTISGRIVVDDAAQSDFYGWLGLIERLERATDRPGIDPKAADHGP
jgi:hypothetical protein